MLYGTEGLVWTKAMFEHLRSVENAWIRSMAGWRRATKIDEGWTQFFHRCNKRIDSIFSENGFPRLYELIIERTHSWLGRVWAAK